MSKKPTPTPAPLPFSDAHIPAMVKALAVLAGDLRSTYDLLKQAPFLHIQITKDQFARLAAVEELLAKVGEGVAAETAAEGGAS